MRPESAVKWFCSEHVRNTPAKETEAEWIIRAEKTEAALNNVLGAKVNRIFVTEVITTLEEIESVECGTHPDLVQNQALTVNNKPDLLDRLNQQLSREVAELLAHTEPLQVREPVSA